MEKIFLIFILLMATGKLMGQVEDDFSDGNFTENPVWTGDTNDFEVNSAGVLHLAATGTDTSILVTPNSLAERTEWTFWIKLSFNTSVNNFARVYLVSDQPDLRGPLNGYFLQIGGARDSIQLVRQTGIQTTVLFQGDHACTNHSTNILRLKMTHDTTGTWTLFSDDSGGTSYLKEGSYQDNGTLSTSWFGIFCRYTSSNATKFYFDEFSAGSIKTDTIPPVIDSLNVMDSANMAVVFNENIEGSEATNTQHYFTNSHGRPASAIPDIKKGNKILLEFEPGFTTGTSDTLTISGIPDLTGNLMADTSMAFSFYKEKAYDIIINEIMADPEPVTGLPESEYVELYNRTGFAISLKGWTFEYGSYSKTFPDISIAPHGYLILTKGIMMNSYGSCVDLFTSYSTLSNEGTTLFLKNAQGKVIHSVSYSIDWYQDPLKDNGGWSLEMMDPNNPCACSTNWRASVDVKGGTPGMINSVYGSNPDVKSPFLKRARIVSDSIIEILFSEPMDSISLMDANQWQADNGSPAIDFVSLVSPGFNSVLVHLKKALEGHHLYSISNKGQSRDCAGNLLDTTRKVKIGLPDSILPNDIVINEILAHPVTGGEKFIELFNRSEKILDLARLVLGTFDTTLNRASELKTISEDGFLAFPGDFILLTGNAGDICGRFTCRDTLNYITMATMPSYNAEGDNVVVATKNDGTLIDRVAYSSLMYSELLTSTAGISLERINPGLASMDRTNWHSASESAGFATPGYENSQYFPFEKTSAQVSISPILFTPDDDGKDDNVMIRFETQSPGFLVNINIFDAGGNRIRNLAGNRLVSVEDGILWDGRDDNNRKAAIGIYIINIELFQPQGKASHFRKTVVLGGDR